MESVAGASSGTQIRGWLEHVARWRKWELAGRASAEGEAAVGQSGWGWGPERTVRLVVCHSVSPFAAGISVVGADAVVGAVEF